MRRKFTKQEIRRFLLIAGIAWTFVILACACGDIDTLFTTAQAVVAGIGVVVAAVGALIPAPVAAAINEGITLVTNALAALKQAYDDYKSQPSSKDKFALVQNAVLAVQQNLARLLAAAKIENTQLQAWITRAVNAVSAALEAVSKDIIPVVTKSLEANAMSGNELDAVASVLNASAKSAAEALRSGYLESLNDLVGLPNEAQARAEDDFEKRTGRHIGPIRGI